MRPDSREDRTIMESPLTTHHYTPREIAGSPSTARISAFFVELSKSIQDQIIARTECGF
jgi:hypothetical protein